MPRHSTASTPPEAIADIHPYVETALQEATSVQRQDWEATLRRMTDVQLYRLRQNEVDLNVGQYTSKKSLRVLLEESHAEFRKNLAPIFAVEPLYEHCAAFVAEQQEALFYHHNDMIFARAQQEMLNGFLDALLPKLQQDGLVDDAQMEKFQKLQAVQSLGFVAYDHLRAIMVSHTDTENPSLVQEAARRLANSPYASSLNLHGSNAHAAAVQASYALAREISSKQYNLNLDDDMVVPPLFFALFDATYHLAALEVKAEHPHIDMRDPKQLDSQKVLDAKYEEIFDAIKRRAYDAEDDYVFCELLEEIQTKIATLDKSPENIGDAAYGAAIHAFKIAERRAPHYIQEDHKRYIFSNDANGKRLPVPRAHLEYGKSVNHYGSAAQLCKFLGYLKEEAHKLNKAENMDQCYAVLSNQLTGLVDEVMFHWTPPAMLLAYQDFLTEFQKKFNESLSPTEPAHASFNTRIDELRRYAQHAYHSRAIIGDWVRKETNNGTDDLFEMVLGHSYTAPEKLTVETQLHCANQARELYAHLCIKKGIPAFLTQSPVVPLMLVRSVDIADEEQRAAEAKSAIGEKTKKLVQPRAKYRVQQSLWVQQYRRDMINRVFTDADPDAPESDYDKPAVTQATRGGNVFGDALERIRDGDGQPDFSIHGVNLLFEYLDTREANARPTLSQGRLH